MFNIRDAATEEIKAIPGKIDVAFEQRVDATVEEIRTVPRRVADSVEGVIKDAVEDVKDALDEVVRVMEEAAGVPEKRLEENVLLPEARRKTLTPPRPPQPQ